MVVRAIIPFVGSVCAAKGLQKYLSQPKAQVTAKDEINGPEWNYNWDHRHPQDDWTDEMKEKYKVKKTRHVYLIRHGQYMDGEKDADRVLSEKGREQARLCGEYLKSSGIKTTQFVHSTMTRATETANIINSVLQVDCKVESSDLIREGCPVEPSPPLKGYPDKPWTEFKESAAIEAGFRKFIRRAKPSSEEHETAVIVCHGNVIRYFFCRGLQLPPSAWLHLSVSHCSITQMHMRPSGTVGSRTVGNNSFMPKNYVTFTNRE